MAQSTKLVINTDMQIADIGHIRRPPPPPGIHQPGSTLALSGPRTVRRVSVQRDDAGNIHLELQE